MTASPYKVKHDKPDVDFTIVNHGTVFIFYALSPEAQEWSAAMFADAMTWGRNGYVVEHRYAPLIMDDLMAQGFVL